MNDAKAILSPEARVRTGVPGLDEILGGGLTRDRMYLDAMQQVYSSVTKVLVESRQGSNLLYLPLDKIMQQSGATAAEPVNGTATVPAAPAAPATTQADTRARDASRTRDRDTR